jgi:hypothetical protein
MKYKSLAVLALIGTSCTRAAEPTAPAMPPQNAQFVIIIERRDPRLDSLTTTVIAEQPQKGASRVVKLEREME